MISPVTVNIHHLITFYVVAKEKSFSEAARKLFLSQQAVTQQIRTLERLSGAKLFNVRRKKVSLTEVGEALFSYAEEIYKQTKNAEMLLEKAKADSFRVGASPWFSGVTARAVARFESLFPDVTLSIMYGPSHTIVAELLDLQYDIALVPSLDYRAPNLKAIRVAGMQRLVFVSGWSTAIPDADTLTLAHLCEYPFLFPPRVSALRQVLLDRLNVEGLELKHPILVHTEYLECLRSFVEKGRAVGIAPELAVRDDVVQRRLRILPVTDYIGIAPDVLVLADSPSDPRTDTFVELIRQAFQSGIGSGSPQSVPRTKTLGPGM
jgi:DNA-binding transcriptional LysR family regulator